MTATRKCLALLLYLAAIGGLSAWTSAARACPFCAAVSLTFTEEINNSQVAVIAKLVHLPPKAEGDAAANSLEVPKARFEIIRVLKGADLPRSIPGAAFTLLGAVYLGALGGTMAALRVLSPEGQGAWRILLLLAIVMASDTAAFFAGNAWGRHRLAPGISPGKTVEGALGGLLGGVGGALAVRALGLPALPLAHAVVLGVIVAAMGIVGDLDESLLKRWAGVKDSGALFPGHGGMLDRLDSLLFGAPVLYYYFFHVPQLP